MAHYSCAQRPSELSAWAKKAADLMVDLFPNLRSEREKQPYNNAFMARRFDPVLIYRGMSGAASATALSLELYSRYGVVVQMAYVRKPGENSHGERVETDVNYEQRKNGCDEVLLSPVFVDDFVATGNTLAAALTEADRVLSLEHDEVHVLQSSGAYALHTVKSWSSIPFHY